MPCYTMLPRISVASFGVALQISVSRLEISRIADDETVAFQVEDDFEPLVNWRTSSGRRRPTEKICKAPRAPRLAEATLWCTKYPDLDYVQLEVRRLAKFEALPEQRHIIPIGRFGKRASTTTSLGASSATDNRPGYSTVLTNDPFQKLLISPSSGRKSSDTSNPEEAMMQPHKDLGLFDHEHLSLPLPEPS
ncbi:hypothetical protein CONLIGDRAFT_649924 [Coniochaeta ligniaria NRRL 30616]|uniref:Uncharacterized protein n=1 Tax=Coniochaeta ligniaria NRRL 30616 TaxID=1408157 RepID=A0A1J7J1Q6_9PEZI|nr:hypothetical protein CONLIGDRAFT_649924 [Coniochaeta ligniaria NRRL 30616]